MRLELHRKKFAARLRRTAAGCLVWMGHTTADGYGLCAITKNLPRRAHRRAWALEHGPIPVGMCVCHHCDNRACCDTAHMFLGTQADNQHDRHAKDRYATGDQHWTQRQPDRVPRGSRHHSSRGTPNLPRGGSHYRYGKSKLTAGAVSEIRAYRAGGVTFRAIAKRFGITHSYARLVALGLVLSQSARRA